MKSLLVTVILIGSLMSDARTKIVGGVEAADGEFPFMVSLQYDSHFCGGSLIGPHWVLTAAHCAGSTQGLSVYLGSNNLENGNGVRISATQVIVHPKFDAEKLDFDFALVKLSRDANVEFVGLNEQDFQIPNDFSIFATTAGWGLTQESSFELSNQLMKVDVPLVTENDCDAAYSGMITDQMICAGLPDGGKDSCQGDSGGPLLTKDAEGKTKLLGVVSWGIGCARPNQYGVYSKVSSVINWIKAETAK
jgi:trypsin